jgi:hypothetical protein
MEDLTMASTRSVFPRAVYPLLLVMLAVQLLAAASASAHYDGPVPERLAAPDQGLVRFLGQYHKANQMLLHVCNMGFFGDWNSDPSAPSCEWPRGSGIEYLYAAGLWVGGIKYNQFGRPDTLVSAAVYQQEFYPKPDPRDVIYQASEGDVGGARRCDDDADNVRDEDYLDGYDNDGDGLIDEDFAARSQEMFACVYYDTSTSMNANRAEDLHVPLELMVRQESYAWTTPAVEDFIGVEYKVKNIGDSPIDTAYVAFMIDGDIGPVRQVPQCYTDDMAAYIDTTVSRTELDAGGNETVKDYRLTVGYMYDAPGGDDGDVPGYIGIMFLGYTDPSSDVRPENVEIHMFRSWSSGEEDPEDDKERYRYMRGISDNVQTIDPPTTRPADYRFLVSAGPFEKIPAGSTLIFQVAFVAGDPFSQFINNATEAQRVYNAKCFTNCHGEQLCDENWLGSSPPPPPKQRVIPGDGKVILQWDDYSERTMDPLAQIYDFDGYQIWRAVGWRRESEVPAAEHWELVAHFQKADLPLIDTGLMGIGKYAYVDTSAKNGLPYWYAVTAVDNGMAEPNPDTGEPTPRWGSYAQAMQLVYPRSEAARVAGKVRIVPNPYPWNPSNPAIPADLKASGKAIGDLAEYERDPSGRRVTFVNLPRQSMVRVYSLSGDLVWSHYFAGPLDQVTGAPPQWNLVSRNDQEIVSGIYIVHIESPVGDQVTKFIVVR